MQFLEEMNPPPAIEMNLRLSKEMLASLQKIDGALYQIELLQRVVDRERLNIFLVCLKQQAIESGSFSKAQRFERLING